MAPTDPFARLISRRGSSKVTWRGQNLANCLFTGAIRVLLSTFRAADNFPVCPPPPQICACPNQADRDAICSERVCCGRVNTRPRPAPPRPGHWLPSDHTAHAQHAGRPRVAVTPADGWLSALSIRDKGAWHRIGCDPCGHESGAPEEAPYRTGVLNRTRNPLTSVHNSRGEKTEISSLFFLLIIGRRFLTDFVAGRTVDHDISGRKHSSSKV